MIIGLIYALGIGIIATIQLRRMKTKANVQDFLFVTMMYAAIAAIGFLLVLKVPVPSPSLFIRKWMMF
ncbi:hypothetical protein [Cohnella sp. JJ-181]|uniref:hypothetical protein n=1 Tax=Cohnella rhizoplanae TaxID=2974897 RepID=UPI0022FFB6AA|nr:hypothetical protein [Cohnella sp. JJ-181]CAI6085555.1 hypothetical protein COHCIP112018_04710 [Cohnella sp. JJ-181]